jgi:hypothetical protein
MNFRRLKPWFVATGLLMWTACQNTRTVPETVFQALEGADHMDVTTSSRQVRTIVQAWRIRKTARLLKRYTQGWQKPLSGTPLSELVFSFYKSQNLLGRFGIGHEFIAMGDNLLWCQPLTAEDRDELLNFLAVQERRSATGVSNRN